MRRLLALVLLIWLIAVIAAGGVVSIGRQQPIPTRITALHLNDCLPPCWIGIVPGKTTIAEARNRILAVFQKSDDYVAKFDDVGPSNALDCLLDNTSYDFHDEVYIYSLEDEGDNSTVSMIDFILPQLSPHEATYSLTFADMHALLGRPTHFLILTDAAEKALQYGDKDRGILVGGDTYPWINQPSDLKFYDGMGSAPLWPSSKSFSWAGFSSTDHYLQRCSNPNNAIC